METAASLNVSDMRSRRLCRGSVVLHADSRMNTLSTPTAVNNIAMFSA
jgi:hypothetical protein